MCEDNRSVDKKFPLLCRRRIGLLLSAIIGLILLFSGEYSSAFSQKGRNEDCESDLQTTIEGTLAQVDLLAGVLIIKGKGGFDTIQVDSSTVFLKEINFRELQVNGFVKTVCTDVNGLRTAGLIRLTHKSEVSE